MCREESTDFCELCSFLKSWMDFPWHYILESNHTCRLHRRLKSGFQKTQFPAGSKGSFSKKIKFIDDCKGFGFPI